MTTSPENWTIVGSDRYAATETSQKVRHSSGKVWLMLVMTRAVVLFPVSESVA
jgi:hypothetical protein